MSPLKIQTIQTGIEHYIFRMQARNATDYTILYCYYKCSTIVYKIYFWFYEKRFYVRQTYMEYDLLSQTLLPNSDIYLLSITQPTQPGSKYASHLLNTYDIIKAYNLSTLD